MREAEPLRIFVQEASPPVRGHELFRGLLQQEGETRTLPLISKALRNSSGKNTSELREKDMAVGPRADSQDRDERSVRSMDEISCSYTDYDFRGEHKGSEANPTPKEESPTEVGPPSKTSSLKVFLSPSSALTPWKLTAELTRFYPDVRFKEECYGLLVRGAPARIGALIAQLRSRYPYDTFVRETVGKTSRAQVFSGFLQVAGEYPLLPLISEALRRAQGKEKTETASEGSDEIDRVERRVSMERCRYIQPIKTIDFVRIYGTSGDEIRCPRAREGCPWEFEDDCIYGLLEHIPARKYWFYAANSYS